MKIQKFLLLLSILFTLFIPPTFSDPTDSIHRDYQPEKRVFLNEVFATKKAQSVRTNPAALFGGKNPQKSSGDPSAAPQDDKADSLAMSSGTDVIIIEGGEITRDTVWQRGTYIVTGDLVVQKDVVLTIQAGSVIQFRGEDRATGYFQPRLRIEGVLIAQGTEQARIQFTSGPVYGDVGDWYGIELVGLDASESRLSYFDLEYAEYGLYISSSNPVIDHGTITNCYVGIYATYNASPLITHSLISRNYSYGVLIHNNSVPKIMDSTIALNGGTGIGIEFWEGTQAQAAQLIVTRSSIYGNGYLFGTSWIPTNLYLNNIQSNLFFNLRGNWWGTPNSQTIESQIYHKVDNPGLPYIDFRLNLLSEPTNLPKPGTLVTSSIIQNQVWRAQDGPFILVGDIVLASNAKLTIEPGTKVVFHSPSTFSVRGILDAKGTPEKKIIFDATQLGPHKRVPGVGRPNYPPQVPFMFEGSGASGSYLMHVDIVSEGSEVYIRNSSPTFNHVTIKQRSRKTEFSDRGIGIMMEGDSAPRLNDLTISDMYAGLVLRGNVAPMITYSHFSDNFTGILIDNGAPFFPTPRPTLTNPRPVVHQTNFIDNALHVFVYGDTNDFLNPNSILDFSNNWWGTTNMSQINSSIYDHWDEVESLYVSYASFLNQPAVQLLVDGNFDGKVDQADYQIWRANFGKTGNNIPGDFNEDGIVDTADYVLWRKALNA